MAQQSQAESWIDQWDRAPLALDHTHAPAPVVLATCQVNTSVHVDDVAQMATGQLTDIVQPILAASVRLVHASWRLHLSISSRAATGAKSKSIFISTISTCKQLAPTFKHHLVRWESMLMYPLGARICELIWVGFVTADWVC